MASEKYTMRGYQFKEFLKGNKEGLKLVLMAGAGFTTWGLDLIQDPTLKGLCAALVAAVVKFGLDALDYWLKD